MPADVNVTERVARAMWASWNPHGPGWHQTDDRSREETRAEARKALRVLADPDVLDGISGVLREAAEFARQNWTRTTNLPDLDDPEVAYSFDRWLDVLADRMARRQA